MLSAIVIGLVAAIAASIPRLLHSSFPNAPWAFPVCFLGIGLVAVLLQRWVFDRQAAIRRYDGVCDLLIHIHSPSMPDSSARWAGRGLISLLLSLFGGRAGPEGAAIEFSQALTMRVRRRSARWFEQRRRTDAAAALAAGISAAFGAPFAGAVFPMEMSFGGKASNAVISALVAFLATSLFRGSATLDPELVYAFGGISLRGCIEVAMIALLAGLVGTGLLRFLRYSEKSFRELLRSRGWMLAFAGGFLLFLVGYFYPKGFELPETLLKGVILSGPRENSETALLWASQLLSLTVVISCFGTAGLVWPVFAAGGVFAVLLQNAFVLSTPVLPAAMAGAASLIGAVFGAPLAGALLAFELTRSIPVLVICLGSAFLAKGLRAFLGTQPLHQNQLQDRGMTVVEGRAEGVLESVTVRDAMVTDFLTVHEHQTVAELHEVVQESRYPFLAVVNAQGKFVGLLTVDLIHDAWSTKAAKTSNSPLAKLLGAKDLLYRSRIKATSIRESQPLSETSGMFESMPCIGVVNEEQQVVGLLFVSSVRLAYDREFARRSLLLENWT